MHTRLLSPDLSRSACCEPVFTLAVMTAMMVASMAGLMTGSVAAQSTDSPADDPAQRARLYRELSRDVAGLERQLSVLQRVAQLVKPTVVHIEASKGDRRNARLGSRGGFKEEGSGVVAQLGEKVYVLTNRHVIKHSEPQDIKIKLNDGREIRPTKVWADRDTDVAVLAVEADSLIPARFGDSSDLKIGQFVLAVGSPFGLRQSVTYGIVSAKGRSDLDLGEQEEEVKIQNFIQTDAAINPGNSGGPLINLRGEVVGINTAIASASGGNEGIGFSIPINMVKLIATQMTTSKNGRRGFLGVYLDSKYTAIKAAELGIESGRGVRVKSVQADTAAEKADLRADDVILEFEGIEVNDDGHLIRLIGLTGSKTTVRLKVFRNGKAFEAAVQLGEGSEFEVRE
jgi:serine protease Do